jgi:hypothetical protein
MGVPPEEFGIERAARDIKTCNYCFHDIVRRPRLSQSPRGYDEKQIKGLAPIEPRALRGPDGLQSILRATSWDVAGLPG